MGLYKVDRTTQFDQQLAALVSKFPNAERIVLHAIEYLEDNALFCGITTNRGLRYVCTRLNPEVPSLVILFHYDEDNLTACLTHVAESPRGSVGYDEDAGA